MEGTLKHKNLPNQYELCYILDIISM